MDGAQLYDKKRNDLKREIRDLKTAHFKTATTINTMTASQSLSFSLMFISPYEIASSQRAIITLTTADNTNMISGCYLTGLTPSNLNDRYPFVKRVSSPAGTAKYEVMIYSQNPNDWDTLSGGGSVNLGYTVQLVGSSKFTVSVAYRSITGGSS